MNPGIRMEGGQGVSSLLSDPHRQASDVAMISRAVREGWHVPMDKRPHIVNRLLKIVDKETCEVMTKAGPAHLDGPADANAIAASALLQRMTAQNLGDIHHQEKQGNDDERLKNERASVMMRAMTDQDWIDIARQRNLVSKLPPRLRELAEKQGG